MKSFVRGVAVTAIVVLIANWIGNQYDQKSFELLEAEIADRDHQIMILKHEIEERDAEIVRLNALPK